MPKTLGTADPREAWATDVGIALIVRAAVTMPFVVPRSPTCPPPPGPVQD
ncbi:hypothetical protein [Streptomyces sp. NBC_01341]